LANAAVPVLLERQNYYVGLFLSRINYFLNILLTGYSRVKFLDIFHKNHPKSGDFCKYGGQSHPGEDIADAADSTGGYTRRPNEEALTPKKYNNACK
jgi:hypothetical protein